MNQSIGQISFQPDIAADGVRHLIVRDLVVPGRIGIYAHERAKTQRVRINIDLGVEDAPADGGIEGVVSYEPIVIAARQLALESHTELVEQLAEKLAQFCLQDGRVLTARVRVEKLDVFHDASAVGVEIVRRQPG
jgi:dihydroneopterin aldolase